jgi:agmatine deiminase
VNIFQRAVAAAIDGSGRRVGLFCAALGVALAGWGCSGAGTRVGFRQPAEFERQSVVWMCPDPDEAEYGPIYARLIGALEPHVRVNILVRDERTRDRVRESLTVLGAPLRNTAWFTSPLATTFIRDGAVFLTDGSGGIRVLDLKWSTYGLEEWCGRLHEGDPKGTAGCLRFADEAQDGIDRWFAGAVGGAVVESGLRLENACFESNGAGVVLIGERLALGRNPGWSREGIEAALLAIPGVSKVIWLGEGLAEDPLEISTITGDYIGMGANGHTDEFVRFAGARTVLLAWVDEEAARAHPVAAINRERMVRNFEILSRATDASGRPFRVLRVPMPRAVERARVLSAPERATDAWTSANFPAREGRKPGDTVMQVAPASYLNSLVANGVVLVPSFVEDGTPREVEERVRATLAGAFPGRSIEFIRCTPMNWHGGGIHCATLSQPRAR